MKMKRICPVCGKEVNREDMEFTRDCINNRLVGILFVYDRPYLVDVLGA